MNVIDGIQQKWKRPELQILPVPETPNLFTISEVFKWKT
jgi:hypothetical protein